MIKPTGRTLNDIELFCKLGTIKELTVVNKMKSIVTEEGDLFCIEQVMLDMYENHLKIGCAYLFQYYNFRKKNIVVDALYYEENRKENQNLG